MLDIEKKSLRREAKLQKIQEEADAELHVNLEEKFELPEEDQVIKLAEVYERIQTIVRVLENFSELKQEGKTRADYLRQLKNDTRSYFGYSDYLLSFYFDLFSPTELLAHLEANEKQRPLTIRVNSMKINRRDLAHSLIAKGVNLDPIKWSKDGLVIYDSQVPLGATPEYLSGQYILQSAASFLPVMALGPQPRERILDMCASPGGKTTHIAALMKNTGVIVANDLSEDRISALVGNIHRMGVSTSIVTQYDGRTIPKKFHSFDRVLLDAPCSGLGIISKDNSIKANKEEMDIIRCAHLQRQLILAAIDAVDATKGPAIIVYSTCSISVLENEAIIHYALARRFVKVQPTGLEFGTPGLTKYRGKQFHPTINLSRRYYPHTHNIDGFFVCKLHKYENGERKVTKDDEEEPNGTESSQNQKGANNSQKGNGPIPKKTSSQNGKKSAQKGGKSHQSKNNKDNKNNHGSKSNTKNKSRK